MALVVVVFCLWRITDVVAQAENSTLLDQLMNSMTINPHAPINATSPFMNLAVKTQPKAERRSLAFRISMIFVMVTLVFMFIISLLLFAQCTWRVIDCILKKNVDALDTEHTPLLTKPAGQLQDAAGGYGVIGQDTDDDEHGPNQTTQPRPFGQLF